MTTKWHEALVIATPEPIFFLLLWLGGIGLFVLAGLRLYDRYKAHRNRHPKHKKVLPATDEDLLS